MKKLFLLLSVALLAPACTSPTEEPAPASFTTVSNPLTNGLNDILVVDDGNVTGPRAANGILEVMPANIQIAHYSDWGMQSVTWRTDVVFIEWEQWGYSPVSAFVNYVRTFHDERARNIPIVVVSENPTHETAAMAAGANYFFLKTRPASDYGLVVQEMLALRPPVPEPE